MHTVMLYQLNILQIRYRIGTEDNTVSDYRNITNSKFKFATFGKEQCQCISVKNSEVHAETLNVITAIKLSDTDHVVLIETDVNLFILLSKLFHHNNNWLCKPRARNNYRIIYHSTVSKASTAPAH